VVGSGERVNTQPHTIDVDRRQGDMIAWNKSKLCVPVFNHLLLLILSLVSVGHNI
jgi:hypothetical protein